MANDMPVATEGDKLLPRDGDTQDTEHGAVDNNQDSNDDTQTEGVAAQIVEAVEGFVESVQDVAVDMKDAIVDAAIDVKEAIVDEIMEVKENLIEELHEADEEEDKFFFLEMSLSRNLSILPGDIAQAADTYAEVVPTDSGSVLDQFSPRILSPMTKMPSIQETSKMPTIQETSQTILTDTQVVEEPVAEATTPLSAYLLLASAVVALSSIGPLLNLQGEDVVSTMKIFWRMTATYLFLLPLALRAIYETGMPHMTYSHWVTMFFTAFAYSVMCVAFVWALQYTSVGNAIILANSQSMLLLAGKIFVGERVSSLEGSGAIVAFLGAVLCSKDSADTSTDEGGGKTLLGDGIALLSAIGGVTYLVLAKTVRQSMNIYVFMFTIMFLGSIQTLLFMMMTGAPVTFDRNLTTGAFGWMNLEADRLPLELTMVLVCNVFGAMGYVRAMHYFDNLVISVAALLEPVVGEVLAFAIGVGALPGWKGWAGNLLVACGTLAVVYQPPGQKKKSSGMH